MKLTHRFQIPYDKDIYTKLKTKQMEVGRVWSDIVQYGNDYYRIFKLWIPKSDLEKMTKQVYELHCHTVQAIVAKYNVNRMATLRRRKSGDIRAKYSWKGKRFYTIPYKRAGMVVSKQKIILKHYRYEMDVKDLLLTCNKKVKKLNDYIEIPNLAQEDISNISYGEIVYKNGYYWFHYVVEVSEKKINMVFKPAGCDLGEIHSLAIGTEDKALIISGRAIRAIKQYRAKALAELSKKMSRCKKGTKKWEVYSQACQRIKTKSRHQIDYLIHKSTKEAIDFLIKEKVSDLVIGDPTGIEKGTKRDPRKRKNRTRRQQLSIWSYGELKEKLEYKCKLNGIKNHFVSESYTSQDCPFCGGRHFSNGRRFICSVQKTEIHREVNGAQNICRKKFRLAVRPVDVLFKQPVWYRRKVSPNKKA
ncbi:RNA-guided endonuclease InsQ/TnpB family protein [Oceanobacillus massiliensis]|uniref:RNA-guided endonuclease InsQ/TnpB family protein n=1 Tax=Oceanobacillus massiliensis TaxID=1465765 RepID=UPI00028820CD|nr:RNA-guided endonuclease TnpB family protein [Oceanobacillus massiliensis]